eukprot:256059_1
MAADNDHVSLDIKIGAQPDLAGAVSADVPEKSEPQREVSELMFIITMSKNLMGSGILLMPLCISFTGIPIGFLGIVLSGFLCWKSFVYVAKSCEIAGVHSYQKLLVHLYGNKIALPLDAIVVILNNFLTCVSYAIVARQMFGQAIWQLLDEPEVMNWYYWKDKVAAVTLVKVDVDTVQYWNWLTLLILIVLMVVFLFPGSVQKELTSARYLAVVGNFSMVYMIGLAIVIFCIAGVADFSTTCNIGAVKCADFIKETNFWWGRKNPLLIFYALTIFGANFDCHVNAPEFYEEFVQQGRNRTIKDFSRVVGWSMLIVGIISTTLGVVSFLTLGGSIEDNFLASYTQTNLNITTMPYGIPVNIGRILLGVSVSVCFVLFTHPVRASVNMFLFKTSDVSTKRRYIVTAVLTLTSTVMGFFAPSVDMVLVPLWAATGSLAVYVIPALAIMKLSPTMSSYDKVLPMFLVVFGVLVTGILGLIMFILETWFKSALYGEKK